MDHNHTTPGLYHCRLEVLVKALPGEIDYANMVDPVGAETEELATYVKLPFVPSPGLVLQFFHGETSFTVEVDDVRWSVTDGVFYVDCDHWKELTNCLSFGIYHRVIQTGANGKMSMLPQYARCVVDGCSPERDILMYSMPEVIAVMRETGWKRIAEEAEEAQEVVE